MLPFKNMFNDYIETYKFLYNIMFRKKSGYKTLYKKSIMSTFCSIKTRKESPKC